MDTIEHVDTATVVGKRTATKTRKRTAAKPDGRPEKDARRALNLRIDEDTYERLSLHALYRRTTISELVMEFARTHLREVYIARSPGRTGAGSETEGA